MSFTNFDNIEILSMAIIFLLGGVYFLLIRNLIDNQHTKEVRTWHQ